ncbi:cation:proton antiporter [Adhaeribacter rhizoryzae]|uniref:Cation:proton antiporter n=1 Tax=Adhaeribacter rhizoryzae TaxID=2607907 RepID=A0A5M6DD23_9BACT|nr:cation:proton antiporter [Adhaeribacter rhizoryzae]KAA5543969.1 cation:proton antiporter [Adhaeribacter rhizoryzae]
MILLSELNFELPLRNPIIIFSLVLFIILFSPILFNKIKVPPIIGLIVAGIIIGPYGLNLLLRDSSIVLFGTVGLQYIMFTAGLEIDLEEFKKNQFKSLVFGLYTFLIPMVIGTVAAYYILGFNIPSAILLSSMFATHTLLAYPITSRYGINRIRAVTLTIGGTIITDVLALLVLAAIVGMYKGDISSAFWIRLAVSSVIFAAIVFFIFPLIARWFFKKFDDNISQYIFVLAIVFLGCFLAEVAGLEAIIGAFLSGLAINRFIPHTSPLMNRIDFVGNALFIPFFLISVGMLVDFSVLFKGFGALKVAAVMIAMAVAGKYLAALLTQKTFKLANNERQMIFGLSNARVGATLAVVLVGYNVILGETPSGEPIRLLSEDVLNGTILMILVTCTLSSFTVEKASQEIALQESAKQDVAADEPDEKILISLAYPETVNNLVDLALLIKPHKSKAPVYALHVRDEQDEPEASESKQATGKKMMEKAINHAAATDNTIVPLNRFDLNISNGIIYTIKEHNITDLIMGLHRLAHAGDGFFGPVTETILERTPETIFIYNAAQPINTLNRIVVAVPPRAEYEQGFQHWFNRIRTIAKGTGLPLFIYAEARTLRILQQLNSSDKAPLTIVFEPFDNWQEFLIFSREVKPDDLFIIVSSRRGHLSYHPETEKLPYYLTKYFKQNSYIILYPEQLEGLTNPNLRSLEENAELIDKAGHYMRNIFTPGEPRNEKS